MKSKAIIFDFDGTLFKTEDLVMYALNKTFNQLKLEGYSINETPSKEKILSVIGNTEKEVWAKLLPGFDDKAHEAANKYILHFELEGAKKGIGKLYPDVIKVLNLLKRKEYSLYVASNGLKKYIDTIAKELKIDIFFTAMYSAGEFNTDTKVELVKKLLFDYGIDEGIMVGDRLSDIDAGKENNLFTIGCNFGFANRNELDGADKIIENFNDLLKVIDID